MADSATPPREGFKILALHSRKGGVGKSLLAYELAWLLGAVLVDFDWEEGGVTRAWGYRWEDRLHAPIIGALERGTTPRPLKGYRKPDLVPSHPDLEHRQPPADATADAIVNWAKQLNRWLIVDTHPGATEATNGVLSVADAVIAPVPLATKDLTATEALVRELADYPLILIPNKVPPVPPAAEIKRLRAIVEGTPVQVGPPVPRAAAVETRKRRMAITSEEPGRYLRPVATQIHAVADFVEEYLDAQQRN